MNKEIYRKKIKKLLIMASNKLSFENYYRIKVPIIRLAYFFGIKTNGIKNYCYLLGYNNTCKLSEFIGEHKYTPKNTCNKCVIIGPVTSKSETVEILKCLTEEDTLVFLKPRKWDIDIKLKQIFFLNMAHENFDVSDFVQINKNTDLLYVGEPLRIKNLNNKINVRKTVKPPPGFLATGFSLNRVICTLVKEHDFSSIYITGVNFHLGDRLYLDDYMTQLRDNKSIDDYKIRRSLFGHDWLYNFLLTKKLKEAFDIKFDVNAEYFLGLELKEAVAKLSMKFRPS